MGATGDEISFQVIYSDLFASKEFGLIKRIYLEGYTISEEAKELGISKEACKKEYKGRKRNFKRYYRKIKINNYFIPMSPFGSFVHTPLYWRQKAFI